MGNAVPRLDVRNDLLYDNRTITNEKKFTGNMKVGEHGLLYPEAVPVATSFFETTPLGFVNRRTVHVGLDVAACNSTMHYPHYTYFDYQGSANQEFQIGEKYEYTSELQSQFSFSENLPDWQNSWDIDSMDDVSYDRPAWQDSGTPNANFQYNDSDNSEFITFTYTWADGCEGHSLLHIVFHPETDNYIEYGTYTDPIDPQARYQDGVGLPFASGATYAPNQADGYLAIFSSKQFEWTVLALGTGTISILYSMGPFVTLPPAALIVTAAGLTYTLLEQFTEDQQEVVNRSFQIFQHACAVGDVIPDPEAINEETMTTYDWRLSDKRRYDYIHRYGDKWDEGGYVGQVLETEKGWKYHYQRLGEFVQPDTDFGGGGGA